MTNIKDLEIEKEIAPLFDCTNHPFAGEALLQLLTDVPGSVEEIMERQQIIRGFLAHWRQCQSFSYSKADLHEVHVFLSTVTFDHWFFDRKKKQQLRAGFTQCQMLFQKFKSYFAALPATGFPEPFNTRIESIKQFLSSFQKSNARILSASNAINTFWENLFLFEAYWSIAKAHLKHHFCFPEFTNGQFSITDLYHPLLKSPVKNSIHNTRNVLLLTGPNMSGKSTLLKAIGLCVCLGHLGLGVPAASCRMPFFDTISVAIHLKDDLKSGYSHFLSEIKTLKSVVADATNNKRCFAVFDELFRGTNMEDALEISKTTIRGLQKFPQSFFVISTHLHPLKELIDLSAISTHYIECHIKNDQPVFTYALKTGWSDVKIGQLLFEQEGLNQLLNA